MLFFVILTMARQVIQNDLANHDVMMDNAFIRSDGVFLQDVRNDPLNRHRFNYSLTDTWNGVDILEGALEDFTEELATTFKAGGNYGDVEDSEVKETYYELRSDQSLDREVRALRTQINMLRDQGRDDAANKLMNRYNYAIAVDDALWKTTGLSVQPLIDAARSEVAVSAASQARMERADAGDVDASGFSTPPPRPKRRRL